MRACVTCTRRSRSANMPASVQHACAHGPGVSRVHAAKALRMQHSRSKIDPSRVSFCT